MGSLQREYRSNEPIILISQVLPVRPAPKIQIRFSGLISGSPEAGGAGEPNRYSGSPARVIPTSTVKNSFIPRAIARTARFPKTGTLEAPRQRVLTLW